MAFIATETPTLTATLPATVTFTPSPTRAPTDTAIPTPTAEPTLTPTPAPLRTLQGPGNIVCPILLYHRIQTPEVDNEYFVTPEDFRAQMQALKDWGYTPIPLSLLVQAINSGAELPERPVVITFDDGDITVYTTAFPIMQEFGYVGVNYLVGNRLGVEGYMTTEQVLETVAADWEVGSHSMTHTELPKLEDATWEITQSKIDLEQALDIPVDTFAYPFGLETEKIMGTTRKHYSAAVGLAISHTIPKQSLLFVAPPGQIWLGCGNFWLLPALEYAAGGKSVIFSHFAVLHAPKGGFLGEFGSEKILDRWWSAAIVRFRPAWPASRRGVRHPVRPSLRRAG